ncbi:esterase E4 [Plutella xylostella]|uniref:esterase E4 n=1 Tax=Plutella xylostella TaxID=51655 RepID=UPI0020328449|nr:esterase E4 [Plutella xylostella]
MKCSLKLKVCILVIYTVLSIDGLAEVQTEAARAKNILVTRVPSDLNVNIETISSKDVMKDVTNSTKHTKKPGDKVKDMGKDEYRIIDTDKGKVRGHVADDGNYFAYLGIPYAAPPVGVNRFKAPRPVKPWSTVYEANHTVVCPQRGGGNEDCLILNVFTPVHIGPGRLPVMVYIHGGSFLFGHGPTDGVEPLIDHNIIVVTINYRLGALGFLCLGTESAPGNAGLKDQVTALKWVNRNIGNFGGDPNNVTLYGMSAGAAAVELLVLFKNNSDKNQSLFHKAIIESGSALNVWTIDEDPIATATIIYKGAKKGPTSRKDVDKTSVLADFYSTVSAENLTRYSLNFYKHSTDGMFGFAPCVELPSAHSEDQFMSLHPRHKLVDQDYHKVAMMFFFASLEGLFLRSQEFHEIDYPVKMMRKFENFLPADLIFDTPETKAKVAQNIRKFYFGSEPITLKEINGYFNYFGDALILNGLLDSVEQHARNNTVYLMEFEHRGKMGYRDMFFDFVEKAGHGDVIKHAILLRPIEDATDNVAVNRVSTIISNFVKFGNPTPSKSEVLPLEWPSVQADNMTYLKLGSDFQLLEQPYVKRMLFWHQIYKTYGRAQIDPLPWP